MPILLLLPSARRGLVRPERVAPAFVIVAGFGGGAVEGGEGGGVQALEEGVEHG